MYCTVYSVYLQYVNKIKVVHHIATNSETKLHFDTKSKKKFHILMCHRSLLAGGGAAPTARPWITCTFGICVSHIQNGRKDLWEITEHFFFTLRCHWLYGVWLGWLRGVNGTAEPDSALSMTPPSLLHMPISLRIRTYMTFKTVRHEVFSVYTKLN